MFRAVAYPRVSTEEQAKEGLSLPHQLDKMAGYANLYGIRVVATEPDEGVSAKSLDRPGLARALRMLDRGEADGILIYKLDRLTRSLRDWDHLISHYFGESGSGKKLWSVNDQVDTTTANGRLFLNFMIMVAQWEREVISERTREQLQYRIRTGSRTGTLLYGRAIDPADPRRSKKEANPVGLVPEPGEWAAIARMIAWRDAGATYRAIAARLTEEGVPTRTGKPGWDHTTVRRIIHRWGDHGTSQEGAGAV